MGDAAALLELLERRTATLAVAESLTGGTLAAALTDVPGASAVFQGALVAYASEVKISMLGVPAEVVQRYGVVSGEAAEAMAIGARTRFAATYALSTTGVAGPEPQEDKPVGTVYVGCAGPDRVDTTRLTLSGTRAQIRVNTCDAALRLLRRHLTERDPADSPSGTADPS